MPFDTYANLKTAIAEWLNRTDLTSRIPDFITLAEAEFNRKLRVSAMEKRSTASATEKYVALPVDWLEARRVFTTVNGSPRRLDVKSADQAVEYSATHAEAGAPVALAVVGRQLEILPTPDQAYVLEMLYYSKIPALSDSNPSNWLLEEHPDLYLYGSLMHSAPYLQHDERIGTWASKYDDIRGSIMSADEKAVYSTSTLKMSSRVLG
ncbi:MAG: hypothetical protein ABFE08_09010 [Armatimonadia bacterium]